MKVGWRGGGGAGKGGGGEGGRGRRGEEDRRGICPCTVYRLLDWLLSPFYVFVLLYWTEKLRTQGFCLLGIKQSSISYDIDECDDDDIFLWLSRISIKDVISCIHAYYVFLKSIHFLHMYNVYILQQLLSLSLSLSFDLSIEYICPTGPYMDELLRSSMTCSTPWWCVALTDFPYIFLKACALLAFILLIRFCE